MSITINLMYNASDKNVVSKSLTTLSSLTGTLKETTSILNPVITFQGSIPTNCNYMYIPDFNRYYFVNDIMSVHNDIFEVSAHVDVLQTYSSGIRNCTGIISRQQSTYNLYLDDGVFKTYQNPTFKLDKFPSGFNDMNFILAVAGSASS